MCRTVMLAVCIVLISVHAAFGCVGKTVFIGHVDTKSEETLGAVYSRLITERTGTSVKLKKFGTSAALVTAAAAGEVDLFILSDRQVKETAQTADREKAKSDFNGRYNLVWLKPLNEKADFLVPVIRKDTLKKFPALPRLLEKLIGVITPARISDLTDGAQKRGLKDTVKDFLKEQNLI